VGLPARSVAFSPNGAHLAVGTSTGVIKVLMVGPFPACHWCGSGEPSAPLSWAQVENLTQKVAEMAYAKEVRCCPLRTYCAC
jgi:hypothetical protein